MNSSRVLLLTALLLVQTTGAMAQLFFRNKTRTPLLVAYAMRNNVPGDDGWFTQGWYLVKPGERVMMNKITGSYELFYYYAQTADGKHSFDGMMDLLVDPVRRFLIRSPDAMGTQKEHPECQFRRFRPVRLKPGQLKAEYTVEFKG